MTGLAAQLQKIKEKNEAEREALTLAKEAAGNTVKGDDYEKALAQSRVNEQREIAAAAKADDERAKKFDEWVKQQGDAFSETLSKTRSRLRTNKN